jgi:hypothetical protein
MIISKIISTAIDKGRIIVKILGSGSKDIKTVFQLSQFGIESRPIKNYRCVYADTGVKGEKVLLGLILNNATINEGETKIYSVDANGVEQIAIKTTNTGNIELGGDTDNLSRHSILESQIHQLRDDYNNLVAAFNQHMHATAAVGSPSIPTPIPDLIPAVDSEIDISTAKIDNILTN